MRRGRGKAKKSTSNNTEDAGSGEEEKIPAQKRRGRPQKLLKDEIDQEEAGKVEKEDGYDGKSGVSSNDTRSASAENEKKRKRNSPLKGRLDLAKEEVEKVIEEKSSSDNPIKLNGFRHNGSRRKNTPRRAAEVGVECR